MNLNKSNHIMEEIVDQQKAWECAISKSLHLENELLNVIKRHKKLFFIGCGSSYYGGIIASFLYDMLLEKKSIVTTSSEFLFYPSNYVKVESENNLSFLISRTGKTSETIIVSKILNKKNLRTIALTTFRETELEKNCTYSIVLEKSEERSITATKSMTSSTMVLLSIILKLAGKDEYIDKILVKIRSFFSNLDHFSRTISSIVSSNNFHKVVFLGSGLFYGVAKESELKVKEMSITNSESYQTLEYRHGHKSILDNRTLVVVFMSDAGNKYEIATAKEFKKIGSKVLIIHDNSMSKYSKDSYDYIIDIDLQLEEILKPLFYQVFGQLLGYFIAIGKDINPSNPRNLDYCVTLN